MNVNKSTYFLEQSSKEKSLGSRNIKESAKDKCRQHERAHVAWPKDDTGDRPLKASTTNPQFPENHKSSGERWAEKMDL